MSQISTKFLPQFLFTILISFFISSCSTNKDSTTLPDATLQNIEITYQYQNMYVGTSQRLIATGLYSDDSTKNLSELVTWESSDTNLLQISNETNKQGTLTALIAGSTTITASYNNTSSSVDISVISKTIDSLNIFFDGEDNIASGSQLSLTAIGNYSDGGTQEITKQVSWISVSSSICSISNETNTVGKLTTIKSGTCVIKADFGNVSNTILFTVTNATLQSISITPTNITLANGSQQQLTATGVYSDDSTQNLTNQVSWQASNTNFSIDSLGLIKTLAVGGGTIQASLLETTHSINITVSSATLTSISISPSPLSLTNGLNQQITATGLYSDNTSQDLTDTVLWESSDSTVLTISNNTNQAGLINTLSSGTAIISATTNDISTTINATVESHPLTPISTSLSALPNIILNDGNDDSNITINVNAIDSSQQVVDGTKINLEVLNGLVTLDETSVITTNGQASFSIKSTEKGLITIQTTIDGTDISNNISIYSTDNFAETIGSSISSTATVINDVVQSGAVFGLAIVNYSNRPFDLIDFKLGIEGTLIYSTSNDVSFTNDVLEPGETIALGWETEQNRDNSFAASYELKEPDTNTDFTLGAVYNLPANN